MWINDYDRRQRKQKWTNIIPKNQEKEKRMVTVDFSKTIVHFLEANIIDIDVLIVCAIVLFEVSLL